MGPTINVPGQWEGSDEPRLDATARVMRRVANRGNPAGVRAAREIRETYMRHKVVVTRVQVAERFVRATSEEDAAKKVQEEFDQAVRLSSAEHQGRREGVGHLLLHPVPEVEPGRHRVGQHRLTQVHRSETLMDSSRETVTRGLRRWVSGGQSPAQVDVAPMTQVLRSKTDASMIMECWRHTHHVAGFVGVHQSESMMRTNRFGPR
jgi:hypothetical protein